MTFKYINIYKRIKSFNFKLINKIKFIIYFVLNNVLLYIYIYIYIYYDEDENFFFFFFLLFLLSFSLT